MSVLQPASLKSACRKSCSKCSPAPVWNTCCTCLQLSSWSTFQQVAPLKLRALSAVHACCTCARRGVISPALAVHAAPATVLVMCFPASVVHVDTSLSVAEFQSHLVLYPSIHCVLQPRTDHLSERSLPCTVVGGRVRHVCLSVCSHVGQMRFPPRKLHRTHQFNFTCGLFPFELFLDPEHVHAHYLQCFPVCVSSATVIVEPPCSQGLQCVPDD